jgi:hypothetical protein
MVRGLLTEQASSHGHTRIGRGFLALVWVSFLAVFLFIDLDVVLPVLIPQ